MNELPPTPDDGFYREILRGIGAPVKPNTMALIYAWRQAEGGRAAYNPFNTTHKMTGSTDYNSVGVQNYATPTDGLRCTIKTLTNGKYDAVLKLLRAAAPPEEVAKAIIASPWGTKGLLLNVLAMYARGKVVVNPITVPPGGLPASSVESAITNAPFQLLSPPKKEDSKALRLVKYALWGSIGAFVIVAGVRYSLKLRKKKAETP